MSVVDINDPEVIESLKYLLIPKEEKIKMQTRAFDAKKACWVADKKEGYLAAEITATKGDDCTVKVGTDTKQLKKADCLEMNPPKYDKYEDMADLTYLNDATVLYNLRSRYKDWFIYTFSGLFCVTINPYKRLPVYTMKMVYFYRGKSRSEAPPHLYSIADGAYANMIRERDNQSMLITGESGAGKTENTKKVIQYFAFVASTGPPKATTDGKKEVSLEDQIVSANPVLEAYGNAKTTRNNNSSRFGKFIRIHFGPAGKIAGADIEAYLLEKSRINYQMPAERNYHIFYQMLTPAFPEYHKMLLVETDPKKYFNIAQGKVTVDGIDDCQEFKDCNEAFGILNFANSDKEDCFKATAAVMMWGNAKFKQRPREEQAEPDGTEECEKVSHLLGIDCADLIKGLTKPRIKVGNEFVNKGQNQTQVVNSIGALCKSIYSRVFQWLVVRVNETLDVKTKRAFFIGVLDIAGFEIFEENGFEQICINYTNERLQQFFNHHMFVVEQEEYKKEGIEWEMMNFGLDLQACIELIEKPLGIMSILEEECIVPKATDKTFQDKLYAQHLGKHPNFGKPKPQKGKKEAHFDLHHYAGTVSYTVTGWLEKNKDPINTTVATLFKFSKTNKLLSSLYQEMGVEEEKGGGKKKGKGGMQTISSGHREQLNKLMNTLKSTSPHFVRCIIPNEIKTGGVLDAHLVMHQLTCNGVLEGIRICRKGFPGRVMYAEFKQRYSILCPAVNQGFMEAEKAAPLIMKETGISEELYKFGHTKVFFKAGTIGTLEEMRDAAISLIMTKLQAWIRLFHMKKMYKTMLEQKLALSVMQRNVKKYLLLREWGWWKLFCNIKPLLSNANAEEERKAKEEEMRLLQEAQEKELANKKELEDNYYKLIKEKETLTSDLASALEQVTAVEEKVEALVLQRTELETQVKDVESRLAEEESASNSLKSKNSKLDAQVNDLNDQLGSVSDKLTKAEGQNKSDSSALSKLNDQTRQQEEALGKLTKDKKRLDDELKNTKEALEEAEQHKSDLTRKRNQLESALAEAEEGWAKEKKQKTDLDKNKKKLEVDLKTAITQIGDYERLTLELEDGIKLRDKELSNSFNTNEDQQGEINELQKRAKDLARRLEEATEELESERIARGKADRQRHELTAEVDEANEKLDEATEALNAQGEQMKRREQDFAKLRRDANDANSAAEANAQSQKKKNNESLNDLSEQIANLQRTKSKFEKERNQARAEVNDAVFATDKALKDKSNVEKSVKVLKKQNKEVHNELEESKRYIDEVLHQKSKYQSDANNLAQQLDEAEKVIRGFSTIRDQLQSKIDEAKRQAEDEGRARQQLASKLSQAESQIVKLSS